MENLRMARKKSFIVTLNPKSIYETHDFEATIKTVEEMHCVIVCLNEQYKNSNMCRTVNFILNLLSSY